MEARAPAPPQTPRNMPPRRHARRRSFCRRHWRFSQHNPAIGARHRPSPPGHRAPARPPSPAPMRYRKFPHINRKRILYCKKFPTPPTTLRPRFPPPSLPQVRRKKSLPQPHNPAAPQRLAGDAPCPVPCILLSPSLLPAAAPWDMVGFARLWSHFGLP